MEQLTLNKGLNKLYSIIFCDYEKDEIRQIYMILEKIISALH